MKHRITVGASLAVALLCGYAIAAEGLKSGPQVGQGVGAFNVLNVSNAERPGSNGQKTCLVWQSGGKSVALIFTREINDPLTSLVKKLDAEVAKNTKKKMAAIVVFLSDDEKAESKLKSLADKEGIKNVSLSVLETEAGPSGYNIAKEAGVTAVLYKQRKVQVNHAFKAGSFTDKSVEAIVADLPKIK